MGKQPRPAGRTARACGAAICPLPHPQLPVCLGHLLAQVLGAFSGGPNLHWAHPSLSLRSSSLLAQA